MAELSYAERGVTIEVDDACKMKGRNNNRVRLKQLGLHWMEDDSPSPRVEIDGCGPRERQTGSLLLLLTPSDAHALAKGIVALLTNTGWMADEEAREGQD